MTQNTIFKKARAAATALKGRGATVEITCHPTAWGNSAYVHVTYSVDGVWLKKGFRLSDHEIGDRRKGLDDVPTIIDVIDITVDYLIEYAILTAMDKEKMAEKADLAKKRRAEKERSDAEEAVQAEAKKSERREAEAAHIELLNAWIAENCPEYDTLNKTQKKKIRKQANEEIYSA